MPFHRLLFLLCLLGFHSQAGAEPIQILAAAASPVHATEVLAVLNQPVDSATVENQMVFFLDDRDRQVEAKGDPDYPYLVRVRFSSSRLQPDSVHYLNLGLRKSAQSFRFDRFTQSPPFQVLGIRQEAERILAAQFPDGSIPLHYRSGAEPAGEPVTVIPYFSHFAARGLLIAYQHSGNERFAQGARRWMQWYAEHMNPDGTVNDYQGIYPDLRSTGDMDSTDSYAALYLTLLRDEARISDTTAFLHTMRDSVHQAVAAIELTLQDDGLTFAKPSYRMKYLMDNIEVREGYAAAIEIADCLGWNEEKSRWRNAFDRLSKILQEKFCSENRQWFAFAVDEAGQAHFDTEYYPGIMAQCFALADLPFSGSETAEALWMRIEKELFSNPSATAPSIDFFTVKAALAQRPEPYASAAWTLLQPNLPNLPYTFYGGHLIFLLDAFQK